MEGLLPRALRAMLKNHRTGDVINHHHYDRLTQSKSGRREPFIPDGSCGDHDDGTASKNRGRRIVNNSGRRLISRDASRGTQLHQPLLLGEDAAFQLTCGRRCDDDDEYRMSSEKLMQARRSRPAKKEEPPTVEEDGSEESTQEVLAAEKNRRRSNPIKKFIASIRGKSARRAHKKTDDLPEDSEFRPLLESFRIYSSESNRMVVSYSYSRSFW